jgi:hypothetical protein
MERIGMLYIPGSKSGPKAIDRRPAVTSAAH